MRGAAALALLQLLMSMLCSCHCDQGMSAVAQLLHAHVPPRQLARALNGAVVGLAARVPDAASGEAGGPGLDPWLQPYPGSAPRAAPGSEQAARSREQPWVLGGRGVGLFAEVGLDVGSQPGPGDLECLGVGLVRAVDAVARRVYLLTPLAPQELQRVSVLLVRSRHYFHTKLYQVTRGCHGSLGVCAAGRPPGAAARALAGRRACGALPQRRLHRR